VHLLDYAVYIYWKQFEMVWLGLVLKLGLCPVAIAHLSPGTHSLLVIQTPAGGSKDVGREHTLNAIHFCPIFYRCIMDKKNHLQLSLASRNPFFYVLDQIWLHILVSQMYQLVVAPQM
jgi:hypothetical protein